MADGPSISVEELARAVISWSTMPPVCFRGSGDGRRAAAWRAPHALVLPALCAAACGFPQPPDVPDDDDGGGAVTVVSTEPAANAASVDPAIVIKVTFSTAIAGSVPRFTVTTPDGDVAGNVSISGAVLQFQPSSALAAGTPFSVAVDAVKDAAGNAATPLAFGFITRTTRCVKPGGGAGCFARPSEAVAAASAGDSIAIAEGEYADNLQIDKSIALLGGFSADFTRRDPATRSSTIRPSAAGTMSVPIIGFNGGAPAILDGLTISDGNNSDHGGGVRIDAGTVKIRNSVIARNNAFFTGGGLYIHGNAEVQLIGNRIEDNTVGGQDNCSGAGLTVETSTVTLRDNAIQRNRVLGNMGTGGGILLSGAVATLVNNKIETNHSADLGSVGGGGGLTQFTSTVTITGGTISRNDVGNTTGSGAALTLSGGTVRLDGVRIEGNSTGTNTGTGASAIQTTGTKLVIASSLIANNVGGSGAIIAGTGGATVIINSTIADNPKHGISVNSLLTVVNSAILRNAIGIEMGASAAATVIRTNAFDGNTTNAVNLTLDSSNRIGDPRIDASYHLLADSPLIDIGQTGPISTADFQAPPVDPPSKDLDGDGRSLMGRTTAAPDIGADELVPSP
jgi:hypothetical protein